MKVNELCQDLENYFETTQGVGVLTTSDDKGNVDVAVYARPHVYEGDHLAFIIETALTGQMTSEGDDETVNALAEPPPGEGEIVPVGVDEVSTEDHREAGQSHVGLQFWNKLAIDSVLEEFGFSEKARTLTLLMTMNRIVSPFFEHAMPGWINGSALGDILGKDFSVLNDDALYHNLDIVHTHRKDIEKPLWEQSCSGCWVDTSSGEGVMVFLYE